MSEQIDERERSERRADELANEVRYLRQALRVRESLLEQRERQLAERTELVRSMVTSRSWQLTRPLRAGTRLVRAALALTKPDAKRLMLAAMFDADWYRRSYGLAEGSSLDEYLTHGWRAGRDPSPLFDGAWYTTEFHDRLQAVSPLEDFVSHPFERRPNRWFDPAIWRGLPDRRESNVVEFLGGLEVGDDQAGPPGEPRVPILETRRGARLLEDGCAACVYAHHDRGGLIDPHVAAALSALARAGRRVVVCSTSAVSAADCAPLLPDVACVLSVSNSGYDWGAYHAGLRFVLDRCSPDSVTLMNDSVYVVPDAFEAFLQRVDESPCDIVGATDSLMVRYHLQSYFIHLGATALASDLIDEFLSTYVPVYDKHYVITSYELGFSRRAMHHGLTLEAVYPLDALVSSLAGVRLASGPEFAPNPTLDLWAELLELGSPFVKAQLLRELKPDPTRMRELVPPSTLRLAAAHLERTDALPADAPARRTDVSPGGSERASAAPESRPPQ